MHRSTEDLIVLLHLWNSILFLLTAVAKAGSTLSGTEKYIMHAIAGNPFMIRTWSMTGSTLFITVRKDNITILDSSIRVGIATNSTVQNVRMMLVYNQTIQEVCLLFENISKEDTGIYEIKDSINTTKTILNETEADPYERKYGTWYLEIYVLEPGERKQGYVGGIISMEFEFETSATQSTLYNYDKHSALLAGSTCSVLTDSSFYGRLRCAADDSGRMYNITIVNITQKDAGLYKIDTGRNETWRCFYSIEESPTCAVVGDNMTIGWFYNQQGMKLTLRVIHPNQGVMMLLHHNKSPQIKSNFQHRLAYSGNTLQSFMSFTLLNVTQNDAGLYTIETLHGNTLPGSKELNVEGTCTTGGGIQTALYVTTKISDTKQDVVTVQPMKIQCVSISAVIAVVTGAVVVSIAIIVMIGCLIWIQRRNSFELETVKRLVVEKCESISLATPYIIRRSLDISPLEEGLVSRLTLSNDLFHHPFTAIPSESGVVDTTGNRTVWKSDVEADNQDEICIADHNGLSKIIDGGRLIAFVKHSEDGNLASYPSVYSLAKATVGMEYSYNCIVDGMDTRYEPHNIHFMENIQRRILEQCETASLLPPSTIRRPPSKLPSEETLTEDQVRERKAFSNAMFNLPITDISTVSAFIDNAWCSTDSPSEPADDKPSVYCITNPNYRIERTAEKTLVSCASATYDGVLDSSAPTRTIGSAAEYEDQIYKCIANGNSSSEISQNKQSLYTPIKKGPDFASWNTTIIDAFAYMGGTESILCGTDYQMVDISTDFNKGQTSQDDSVVSPLEV